MMKFRRVKIKWFNIALMILAGYFVYTFIGQQIKINALDKETMNTKAQIEKLQNEAEELKQERDRLNTPTYVEKIAREELGLVKPGEVPYVQVKNN